MVNDKGTVGIMEDGGDKKGFFKDDMTRTICFRQAVFLLSCPPTTPVSAKAQRLGKISKVQMMWNVTRQWRRPRGQRCMSCAEIGQSIR